MIASKSAAMFLNKSVNRSLLQNVIEGTSACGIYKDLVEMAPDENAIMRAILANVPLVSTIDMEAYMLEHQYIHSQIMKADPQGKNRKRLRIQHI